MKVHGLEVIEMCITEYDEEKTLSLLKKDAYMECLESVAKKMKEDNCPVSKIQKYTGLDSKEISLL